MRELRDLIGGFDVAGEQNDTTQPELARERSELDGNPGAIESGNQQLPDSTTNRDGALAAPTFAPADAAMAIA